MNVLQLLWQPPASARRLLERSIEEAVGKYEAAYRGRQVTHVAISRGEDGEVVVTVEVKHQKD